MFGKIRGMLKASEATVVAREALKSLPLPSLPFDPEAAATRLVAMTYSAHPDAYSGRFGPRPHAIATAAVALAAGLHEEYEFDRSARQCVFAALGNVLLDASAGHHRFSGLDGKMLELADQAHADYARGLERARQDDGLAEA